MRDREAMTTRGCHLGYTDTLKLVRTLAHIIIWIIIPVIVIKLSSSTNATKHGNLLL